MDNFELFCRVMGCKESVKLPSAGPGLISIEPAYGWSFDPKENFWRCPKHASKELRWS